MTANTSRIAVLVAAGLLALGGCSGANGPDDETALARRGGKGDGTPLHLVNNPKAGPGEKLFERHCASCHASEISPLYPGTFSLAQTRGKQHAFIVHREDLAPETVAAVVRAGISFMPSFGPTQINDQELTALSNYVAGKGS